MQRIKTELLKNLADSVVKMDENRAVELAKEALEVKIDAYEAITYGLSKGMEIVGRKYENGEYFIPELLVCSDAMYAGIDILKPHIKADFVNTAERIVIGVVEGDTHDIGKNLVKIMFESSGFEVHDLGRDVPLKRFVEEAEKLEAQMICMSTLMTTTMMGMEGVINMLQGAGLRERFKVLVGGGPISQAFAVKIGADGYAHNAPGAVKRARELLKT